MTNKLAIFNGVFRLKRFALQTQISGFFILFYAIIMSTENLFYLGESRGKRGAPHGQEDHNRKWK